jgi:hypothetical protein
VTDDEPGEDLVNQTFPVPLESMPRGMQLAHQSTERDMGIIRRKPRWWQRILRRR